MLSLNKSQNQRIKEILSSPIFYKLLFTRIRFEQVNLEKLLESLDQLTWNKTLMIFVLEVNFLDASLSFVRPKCKILNKKNFETKKQFDQNPKRLNQTD